VLNHISDVKIILVEKISQKHLKPTWNRKENYC